MRAPALLLLLALGDAAAAPAVFTPVAVSTAPVPFDASDAARDGAGRLRYLGGIVLSAPAVWFGGWSALACPDLCYAVGDAGAVLRFGLVEEGGRLVGIAAAEGAAQLDGAGAAGDKTTRDAESLTISPGGSEALVGYEGGNSFWVVPLGRDRWQASRRFSLPEMADWPSNGGPETLAMLPSRRPVVIAESGGETRPAIIIGGREGGNVRFRYAPPEGFSPTDAAVAGDRLLVLNRAFSPASGVAMALVEIDVAELVEGALVSGREIARLRPPVSIDNMEGIAVSETGGRSFLYLISDDNFNALQRTLLLKFELLPDSKKPADGSTG